MRSLLVIVIYLLALFVYTDSLYFHEEELDEINYLAQFGEEMKGRVSDRVKGIEGLTTVSSPSSDSCCTTSTEDGDQDEDDGRHGENNGCHGKNNGRHGEDDGYHGEDNGCHENEWNGNDIVRTASRQARIKWQERNEGKKECFTAQIQSPSLLHAIIYWICFCMLTVITHCLCMFCYHLIVLVQSNLLLWTL